VGNLSHGGQLEVEFSGDHVDHRGQVASRAEATGFSLGGLNQAVNGLQQSVADSRRKPAQHAGPVRLDRLGRLDPSVLLIRHVVMFMNANSATDAISVPMGHYSSVQRR
jgi:hypothetical protein